MRVLVCGGRRYDDNTTLSSRLNALHAERSITLVIHGGAAGADRLAQHWAVDNGVEFVAFAPDWSRHALAAGPMRNAKMLRDGRPDLVLAFPGGRGTIDMVRQAEAAGGSVERIGWKEPSKLRRGPQSLPLLLRLRSEHGTGIRAATPWHACVIARPRSPRRPPRFSTAEAVRRTRRAGPDRSDRCHCLQRSDGAPRAR